MILVYRAFSYQHSVAADLCSQQRSLAVPWMKNTKHHFSLSTKELWWYHHISKNYHNGSMFFLPGYRPNNIEGRSNWPPNTGSPRSWGLCNCGCLSNWLGRRKGSESYLPCWRHRWCWRRLLRRWCWRRLLRHRHWMTGWGTVVLLSLVFREKNIKRNQFFQFVMSTENIVVVLSSFFQRTA